MCALAAVLTERQKACYLMSENTVCHLSVSKAISQQWRDVGLFVKECLSATDWVRVDTHTAESQSMGAFKSKCDFEVGVQRNVTAIGKNVTGQGEGDISASEIDISLAQISPNLWAKKQI